MLGLLFLLRSVLKGLQSVLYISDSLSDSNPNSFVQEDRPKIIGRLAVRTLKTWFFWKKWPF